ncbi:MAG: hypothetical protein GWP14_03600 [Actinobacteria bacterium]|nr:hypothetical protein [Actinomycetota bacterium]
MSESLAPKSKRDILRIFFSRWPGILVIFLIITGSVVLATLVAPKWYRSSISFKARRPRPISLLSLPNDMFQPTEIFLRTQQAVILSQDVVSRALARLDGAVAPAAIDQAAAEIRRSQQPRLIRQIKHIKVTTPVGDSFSNSEVFFINVEVANSPTKAQQLTNLIAEEYRIKHEALQNRPLYGSTAVLQKEIVALKKQLDQANRNLVAFIRDDLKGDMVAFRAISSAATPLAEVSVAAEIDKEVKTLQADLIETVTLKAELDKELTRVVGLSGRDPLDTANIPVVPERVLMANPSISSLAGKLTDLRLKAIELEPRYTEDFRERQNVAQEIELTSSLLVSNLANVSTALAQEITIAQARIAELSATLQQDQAYMKGLSSHYVRWISLNDEADTAKAEYDAKKAELKSAQTAESMAKQKVFLTQFDTALLPDSPVRPILWVNTLVGAIVALLFALGYCFVADYLDHRFKTVEQAEQYLDLPVLGSVGDLGRRIISRR